MNSNNSNRSAEPGPYLLRCARMVLRLMGEGMAVGRSVSYVADVYRVNRAELARVVHSMYVNK